MAELLTTITELPVADIEIGQRLRPASEAGVQAIIASIGELGVMKDPIHVRRLKDGKTSLLAGLHRLTAARELGWETIKVACWRCNDDFARLMEIDDNLAGAELTALDTAVFLAERKRVYEKLHPETKAAAFKGNQHTGKLAADTMSVATFAATTAEKFGITERHVRRMVAAGERLAGDEVSRLRKAARPVGLKDLQVIGTLGPTERYAVVDALAEGKAKSAAKALAAVKAPANSTPPVDPHEQAYLDLCRVWKRASAVAQRRFADEFGHEVVALIARHGVAAE
ncbi:ParB/RepB/Spo0J family partition protein [Chachezhania sediminis]|uniref:ParB/RepB/Spo0J family partition protein n=1 Tax=Chachezhania sediminis TaxID=2599291 RepID=UPI00131D418E|nr:ParB/RepB/Spo0J family partition protein [Chachezhania sediminis]